MLLPLFDASVTVNGNKTGKKRDSTVDLRKKKQKAN